MYSLLKLNKHHIIDSAAHSQKLNTNYHYCLRCLSQYFEAKKDKTCVHLSRPYSVQYASILKHILNKKYKKFKKKSKRFTEVLQSSDGSVTSSKASIDMLRGKKLTALTNQLYVSQTSASNIHTIIRNHFTDTTRNFDPLSMLPVDNTPECSDHISPPPSITELPTTNVNSRILRLHLHHTSSNFVPDIVKCVKKSIQNGEQDTDVTVVCQNNFLGIDGMFKKPDYHHPVIPDLGKINNVRKILIESQKELRKKLRLRTSNSQELKGKNISTKPLSSLSGREEDIQDFHIVDGPFHEEFAPAQEPSVENVKPMNKLKGKSKAHFNVNLKKSTREAIAKQRISDLERSSKIENLNSNFLSYVDVCVNTGMINDALYAIKAYRKKVSLAKNWYPKLNEVDIYNIVMEGYAKEGDWRKVNHLLEYIKEDGVNLNERSYAAIFECLGHAKNLPTTSIKNYLEEMTKQGIDLSNVINSCALGKSSFNRIIRAVKSVDPNFEPKPLSLDISYDCPLLETLRHENRKFKSPSPSELSIEQLENNFHNQLMSEMSNYVKIKTVEKRQDTSENITQFREKLTHAESHWRGTIEAALEREFSILKAQGRHKSHFFFTLYPYLMTLSRDEYVEIILQEIRKLAEGSETYSPMTKQLYRALGAQVCMRYQIKKKTKDGSLQLLESIYTKYVNWYLHPEGKAGNTRQKWQELLNSHKASATLTAGEPMWRSHVLVGVGRFLYNIIIRDVKIDVNIMRINNDNEHYLPAFYTLFRNKGHMCKEEVKPHPILSRLFRASAQEDLIFEASMIPMVCPPQPWTTITSGGYLLTKAELIRLPFQAKSQWKEMEKTPVNKLYPVFDSLNQLGSVPWTVNEEVLDVILKVFHSGGSSKLDVPEPPSACPAAEAITPDMSPQERYQNYRQRLAVRRRRAEMYSLWCDALYKLSLANHFRKKIFWLPHNMDFRGRVYPVAPHLNHLGGDLSRSLLVFAKGEPLGADGLNWLKIHAINLTGTHKKQSMECRLDYANKIIDDIIDSAENPLTGRMWWTHSEEPWQTLATCVEIKKAIDFGDSSAYVSKFPVHQDGSCNGLQHYAALGRDQAGGASVNLTPSHVPQDVYSCVVSIVERERTKDAANGVKIAQVLNGFVSRKVIKQTVMTTVYGVTRFGARLQIARQLKDLDNFPKEHVWGASLYLVNKTFESLQEMFTSTKEIQDWFTECARLIAQVCGENVQWITPLGLPVVQPYSRAAATNSADHIKFIGVQSRTVSDAFERPNIMKQKNAFAPNFIHSLDSTHMMLTSLHCDRAGVTFVSVHDCYWTHPSTVAAMNEICRQQFVALHSHPILQDLSKYFVQRFAYEESCFNNDGSVGDTAKWNLNRILRAVPSTGSLDLKSVLISHYFFS